MIFSKYRHILNLHNYSVVIQTGNNQNDKQQNIPKNFYQRSIDVGASELSISCSNFEKCVRYSFKVCVNETAVS